MSTLAERDVGTPSAAVSGRPHWNQIDGLRALAATCVFMWHAWFVLIGRNVMHLLTKLGNDAFLFVAPLFEHIGQLGVSLFYSISGFVLYHPFARARDEGTKLVLRTYMIRRVARIVPAYWAALIIIGLATSNTKVFTLDGFVNYFLFMELFTSLRLDNLLHPAASDPNNVRVQDAFVIITGNPVEIAWTLCVEVSFYIVLPLWAALMHRITAGRRRPIRLELILLGGVMLASFAYKAIIYSRIASLKFEPWLLILPNSIDIFALGMALALLAQRATRRGWPRSVQALGSHQGAALGGAVLLYLAACLVETSWSQDAAHWPVKLDYDEMTHWMGGIWGELNLLIAGLVLIPAVVGSSRGSAVGRILAGSIAVWIGLVSYGLYLWHIFVLSEFAGQFQYEILPLRAVAPSAVVCYLLSLVVAAVSWYGLERRFQRRAQRLPLTHQPG